MPCSVDVLVMRTGLGVPEVSAAIVQLELAGLIENTAAGVARLR
jgi:predicted Rossmann fold nucleotide-binding protein DprA/Smf involved in DNA uptake